MSRLLALVSHKKVMRLKHPSASIVQLSEFPNGQALEDYDNKTLLYASSEEFTVLKDYC